MPSFFFISGFLFFNSIKKRAFWVSFKEKIKKRFKTLLIPYFFWNVFGILLGIAYVKIGLATEKSYFREFNFLEFIWNSRGDIPLWYVKYLFIICLFSPVIFLLFSKYANFYAKRILLCAVLLAFLLFYGAYYDYALALWFAVGAFFALEKIDFISLAAKYFYAFFLMYAASCAAYFYLHFFRGFGFNCNSFVLLFGVPFFFGFMARFKIKIGDILVRNTFFIYCFHTFISKLCERLALLLHNLDAFSYACVSMLMLVFQIAACIFAAEFLRGARPRFFKLINGGR